MRSDSLTRFLFLPDLTLKSILKDGPEGATYVLEKASAFEVCPHCATKATGVHDHRTVDVRDAPIRGKHVWLRIIKRRFRCPACRRVFMEPVRGISKRGRVTERFKREILWAAEKFSSLAAVGKAYRCSTGFLYRTVYAMLELERRRKLLYPWPNVVGLDEHSFRRYEKGRIRFVTAVVDYDHDRLYEVVDAKAALGLKEALAAIPGREGVKRVVIDLAEHYRSFARDFFRGAEIVADRFHVQRLFSRLLNRKRLEKTGNVRKHPIRSLVLRNAEELDGGERRELWEFLDTHGDVKELYQYKESIRRFYRTKGAKRGRRAFVELVDRMARSHQQGVLTLRATLQSWAKEILAYHRTGGLTNGRTEGFNRVAKLVQRRAFGYRSFKNYRLRLLNACA